MEKVSVIMPAYNAEKYIGEAIESVLSQTYSDLHLYILNDCSIDETKNVIVRYEKQHSDKITLIDKEENAGTAAGLNTLLEYVCGEYICWLSADDLYKENMIKDSIKFLENNLEYDIVFADYENIDENSNFLRESPFKKYKIELKEKNKYQPYRTLLTEGCCINGCTLFAKAICYKGTGRFQEKYKYAQDYDMWLRMVAQYNIGYIDKVHVQGREHPEQFTNFGNNELDALAVLFKFLETKDMFRALYQKAGYRDDDEAIAEILLGQLKMYKSHDKEFQFLYAIMNQNKDLFLSKKTKCIFEIADYMYDKTWKQNESYFDDASADGYMSKLCKIMDVNAIFFNKQAIRFDRFKGNSLERFNNGLMRSNDIVVGTCDYKKLQRFLNNNQEYRYYISDINKKYITVGFSYFMLKNTDIVEKLNIQEARNTGKDIWWELIKEMVIIPN